MDKKTRGCRNNNPLNIRRSRSNWLGKIPFNKSSDSVFEQFDTMEHGIRAAMFLLRKYIITFQRRSVPAIIRRWAPASDGNNVEAYIDYVSKHLAFRHCSSVFFNATPSVIVYLVQAMAYVESSLIFSDESLFEIYRKYFQH